MNERKSKLLNKSVRLYFRADALINGFGESTKGWIGGTRWIQGIVRDINVSGVLMEIMDSVEIGRFLFENATLFFPWDVIGLLDLIEEEKDES